MVLRAPEHQRLEQANKPPGVMPVTDEQDKDSNMRKKILNSF